MAPYTDEYIVPTCGFFKLVSQKPTTAMLERYFGHLFTFAKGTAAGSQSALSKASGSLPDCHTVINASATLLPMTSFNRFA